MLTESFNKLDLQIKPFEVSKKIAETTGQVRYYTGKPCGKGHRALRRSNGGSCLGCEKTPEYLSKKSKEASAWRNNNKEAKYEYNKKYAKKNPERVREYKRSWKKRNPEKVQQFNLRYVAENREVILEKRRQYYIDNKDVLLERGRKWARENRGKVRAKGARYRASLRKATLRLEGGVSRLNDLMIGFIYDHAIFLSEATGVPHEVDHIVPLQGKTVSGLHVWNNLQIVTQEENRRKSNKVIERYLCQIYS